VVAKNYINAEISVNLRALRKFRVYLTGEVDNPGTYFAQGSDRLSDVLEVSAEVETQTGMNDWADDTRIQIQRIDGKQLILDITHYYRFGDKSANPYLRGGDIIFVPSIDLNGSYVIIEGNVGWQGIYPLKPNENLFTFLRRVTALSRTSNLENIILIRNGERMIIDLLNKQDDYLDFVLNHKDKLIIPRLFRTVYIRGEVFTPGELPYLANYKAKDYIGVAGALDSAVGEDKIIVVRQSTGEVLKGGDILVEKGDTIILPKRNREVFKDYMTIFAPIISLAIATVALVQK
jgi:protein involved in polysaccharide export with SLBB domain